MINGQDEGILSAKLNELLSPSDPIRSEEFLLGRESNLRDIRRHLAVKGRHVFIFGDRGVGKTSLAQTSAIAFHPSDSDPIRVAGAEGENFETIVGTIAKRVHAKCAMKGKTEIDGRIKAPLISAGMKKTIENGQVPIIDSLNDAIDALSYVTAHFSGIPVIVIDEFDRLSSESDKVKFAELIKQISDQEVNIKLIFCGIGDSMHSLLGAHYSTGRSITPIELPRLDHNSLVRIVTNAVEGVGLTIDDETSSRIAILSDGFPYFAHLVTEKMIWAAFDDDNIVTKIGLHHFGCGIDAAVSHAMALLREAYEIATKKYSDSYEEVLWALVDKPTLTRQSANIYNESYVPIMRSSGRKPLDLKIFYNRLNALKSASHGNLLNSPRRSWFEFSENMVRGYVKLKAAERRVDLGIDHHNRNSAATKKLDPDYYNN